MLAWGTTWLGSISGDTMRERIDAVRAQVDALPRLVLYVPTLLDAEGLDKIGSWLRTSFPETYLLDIEVDPQVIGGCAFIKNGQYVDYSFSARLRSQSNLIPEVIASYVS
jgi:F0F1-type ATP synthase delta subunit